MATRKHHAPTTFGLLAIDRFRNVYAPRCDNGISNPNLSESARTSR